MTHAGSMTTSPIDPDAVSLELELLTAQAFEVAIRGFETNHQKQTFYHALSGHLNELSHRLWTNPYTDIATKD